MKYKDFFSQVDLEQSLLLGYYGGGNFGDELLLEIMLRMLQKHRVKRASFYYLNAAVLPRYHLSSPYRAVCGLLSLGLALARSRSIVIGGGGLWGLDANKNVFLMSLGVWFCKLFLRKRVYLIGVGYHSSTNRLGHVSAWLAAKAATHVIARDAESYRRFKQLTPHVSQDTDIAFLIDQLDLSDYDLKIPQFENLKLSNKMIYATLREFRQSPQLTRQYEEALASCIAQNKDIQFVVSLLDPPSYYPSGYKLLQDWQQKYDHVQVLETDHNPLTLLRFFNKHAKQFKFITPQFHAIITAILCHIPYLPLVYDNKVAELLEAKGVESMIPLQDIQPATLEAFAKD